MSIQRTSFYVLLAVVTIAFIWLLIPYYSAVFWAVILAIIFFPVHKRLEHLLGGRRGIAALLTVLMCICLVIVPAMIILGSLIQEGTSLYQRISSNEIDLNGYLVRIQNALPPFIDNWLTSLKLGGFPELGTNISSAAVQASRSIGGSVLSFGQNTLQLFISFGISFTCFSSCSEMALTSAAKSGMPSRSATITRGSFSTSFPQWCGLP